jgi:hypothetical protein
MKFKCVRPLCNYYKIRMLWFSQNHNNYAAIHEHLIKLFMRFIRVRNSDAIIIQKLRCYDSPKIIMIITTSLSSNNFTDVHK